MIAVASALGGVVLGVAVFLGAYAIRERRRRRADESARMDAELRAAMRMAYPTPADVEQALADVKRRAARSVQLVVTTHGLHTAYVGEPERAAENARNIGGVVVTLPVSIDYRMELQ